jgi:site-specific DNA recombinase
MNVVRCAIYTRKSSEEGLEQAFNSLDAQREACAAYVLSQASEGWTALADVYDDGGLSGGSLERPALRRLLADVAAKKVDIIVVYKVDRLTRSLLDFAKLVEAFDGAGVSFVSVTQSFNTTTSMGRLTLNMLLSFAQFEREVTAERIRDKIAASKAKGMWMGGTPPLGYEPDGRTLRIVPEHAAIVLDIYDRYLTCGNVRLVAGQLERDGVIAPTRKYATGREFGGVPFSRGQIHYILKSAVYVGDIPHRDKVHAGQHPAIIARDTWDYVQAKLADNVRGERRGVRTASPSVLAGKIVDAAGEPLIASHACKGTRRYRYYVSRPERADDGDGAIRIPALEVETAVTGALTGALQDPIALMATAWLDVAPAQFTGFAQRALACALQLAQRDRTLLRSLVQRVRVLDSRIEIECDAVALAAACGVGRADATRATITLGSEVRLTRTGRAMRLVQGNGSAVAQLLDLTLLGLVARARRWWGELKAGQVNIKALAKREGVSQSYMTRVVRLAFLAPVVVEAIVAGKAKAGIGGASLTATEAIAAAWNEQKHILLPTQ